MSKVALKEDILFYMSIALHVAKLSTDANTQVGTVLVKNNCIIGSGFNHFPDNYPYPTGRDITKDGWLNTKYPFVIHSEVDAIAKSHCSDFSEVFLYTSLFPCNECAKTIIAHGIPRVYYYEDKYPESDLTQSAKLLFRNSSIHLINVKSVIEENKLTFPTLKCCDEY